MFFALDLLTRLFISKEETRFGHDYDKAVDVLWYKYLLFIEAWKGKAKNAIKNMLVSWMLNCIHALKMSSGDILGKYRWQIYDDGCVW